ncbi:hypothetical protein [Methylobacter sp.]|uniref:hypothetical protein n=1 Tax=Methylobacter sp. TaxID=2051955 RepID=UPI00121B671C|nr:hypothetical protein [Methylobacter sp.]TAK59523.1 MAG: hypothetical protein EPO18_20390 [Methylobacter sp.]
MRLAPFEKKPLCVKCGSEDVAVSYMDAKSKHLYAYYYKCPAKGEHTEHLMNSCRRCSYAWCTKLYAPNDDLIGPIDLTSPADKYKKALIEIEDGKKTEWQMREIAATALKDKITP